MRDIDNLCINCFNDLTQGSVCTECGYDNDIKNETMYLPEKSILSGKYVVGAFNRHESDAVTYSGYDSHLDKAVIIREFFPKGFVNRLEGMKEVHIRPKYSEDFEKYKKSFYKLWTTLEKMHSLSAVVPVYDVFEENGTVYSVIEKIESIPLREYLLRNQDGYISWDNARLMFMPVLTTIEALHNNGIIHGSITPDSLVLCRDGKVRLSEFCIQEAADISAQLEFNVNDGYTALEQYENNHKICPATDIYAFSACIYRALVGTNPPAAPVREANDKLMIPNKIAETIPMHVIKAMGNGLQIYPEKRIKSIAEFREFIDAAPAVQMKSVQTQAPSVQENKEFDENGGYPDYDRIEKEKSKKSKIVIGVLIVLIIAAIAAGAYLVKVKDVFGGNETTTESTTVATYVVPNFANNGYTQSDIENNGAWNEQFSIKFESDYSTDAEEGIVFKQSIEAGKSVDAGSEIVLTVSKGIQTQTIPDVGTLTVEEATQKLEELGFKVTTVEIYNDGSHTKGTVKAKYGIAPADGTVAAVGEEIVLQVYGEVHETTTAAPETTDED